MDLRQLRYFVTVASERNFTKAAQRLHIAQPPLSRQIQLLEAEVGARLLDRSVRPLVLTPVGRLFMDQAIQILRRLKDMESLIERAARAERRRFVIGFVASTIYARLPALIREFRAAAPHVDLSLIEIVSVDQISALKEGKIDVGFGRIRLEDGEVSRSVLREERLVAALPAAHILAAQSSPLPLTRLAEEPLIIYPRQPRPSYADQVLSLFRDQGHSPKIAHEARELQIALGLVAAEEGICLVPESVQKSRVDDVTYREVLEPATSPIIMSHRVVDQSPEIVLMGSIIARMYAVWGYQIPEGLQRFAAHEE